ncbi:acyltransferase family protein [Neorhizobium petrolearium]|uniref:acyltransferase family protein n=1 Tax=Neorhizobium petrolearium TaxID=515361 RepID=UPI003F7F6488
MSYRPEIDGLRAVAVVSVLLYHAGIWPFTGGYVGVDVFFVISGYLISGIILREVHDGLFSVVGFYNRRIRRIYPALLATIIVSTVLSAFTLYADDFKDFGQSVVATLTFSSNLLFWFETDYFAPNAELKPLLHTWSLAVEEQFYVLFPLLLILTKRWSFSATFFILSSLTLASFCAAQYVSTTFPVSGFFLLPFRMWELLAGALLALYETRYPRLKGGLASLGAVLGLLLIVYAVLRLNQETPFPGVFALIPVCGSVLVIRYAHSSTPVGRLLSSRLAVGIGLISYSLYLVHQPIFALYRYARPAEPSWPEMLGLISLSILLAALSWKFVEQPVRKASFSSRKVFAGATFGSLILICVGAVIHVKSGFPAWTLARLSPEQAVVYRNLLTEKRRVDEIADGNRLTDCIFRTAEMNQVFKNQFAACAARHGPALMIVGDSHAGNLFDALAPISQRPFVVGLSKGFCRAVESNPQCFYDTLLDFAEEHSSSISLIVYMQAGFYLLDAPDGTIGSRDMFHRYDGRSFDASRHRITLTLSYLRKLSLHTPMVWLGPWIDPHVTQNQLVARGCDGLAALPNPFVIPSYRHLDEMARAMADQHQITYVSTISAVNFDPRNDILDCRHVYFMDADHWSEAGGAKFGPLVLSALIRTLPDWLNPPDANRKKRAPFSRQTRRTVPTPSTNEPTRATFFLP